MMKDMSFLEKLKVLVDVSSSSGLCIASIFIILFLGFVLITTNKKNIKSTKKFFLLVYISLIIVMLVQYGKSLSSMFDYMMNNFFIVVYFPNLAIYLAAIIATNIILWVTILNFKEDKLLKIVNTVIYCIMHYLLILILNIVNTKKLDVFDKASVYGNNNALALIGLSSTIFLIWIVFIIIYKIIRARQNKNMEPLTVPNVIKISSPKYVRTLNNIKYVEIEKLPDNIRKIPSPRFIRTMTKIQYVEIVKEKIPESISKLERPRYTRTKDKIKYIEKIPDSISRLSSPHYIRQTLKPKYVEMVVEKIPESISKLKSPKYVKLERKVEYVEKNKLPDSIIKIDTPAYIISNKNNHEDKLLKQYENMLTLDDYKMVLEILKNGKLDTNNETPINLNTEVVTEYNIPEIPQPKLDELLNLSKSVN